MVGVLRVESAPTGKHEDQGIVLCAATRILTCVVRVHVLFPLK